MPRKKTKNLVRGAGSRISTFVGIILLTVLVLPVGIIANGGDNGAGVEQTNAGVTSAATIVSAERNIQNESGSFNFILKRSPGDPRVGESESFVARIGEKVEGGFGGSGPVAIDNAKVSAKITKADGKLVAGDLAFVSSSEGNYRTAYSFGAAGDYKIVFELNTEDGRKVLADFPITVSSGPFRRSFWLGFLVLISIALGSLGMIFYSVRQRSIEGRFNFKRALPLSIVALTIFAIGLVALIFLVPPREIRAAAKIPEIGANEIVNDTTVAKTLLTVAKESQMLFGIKTEPIAIRSITSGLRTTGVVKASPDARAVVMPPVSGRIVLRGGVTLGSAVARGEQIGYVEQVLDVAGQVGLEAQRLDVKAKEREVESKKLELRNAVLQLRAQRAEQQARAQQARTQLAQDQREQRRAENLVEVGAVPKKRLEEAITAVKVAEQSVVVAEKQVGLIDNQIEQTQAGEKIFVSPRVNQPSKTFALTAPTTGIINEINVTSGQQVDVGTQIVSIINLSKVLIEAQVFERDLPVVRDSSRASFTNAALSGEVYTIGTVDGDGRLVSVGQVVNQQTRTVPILYEMKNPLGRLKDGMFVDVTIDTTGNREVLAVPKQAVVTEQGQTFVFVFDGGETFEKRPVALAAEGADFYEIKTGLKEGERVVTEGIYQLRSTQPST